MQQSPMKVIRRLGSLRITFAGMLVLATTVLWSYLEPAASTLWTAVPLAVLALNLVAAVVSDRRLNRQHGLLVFHLGLLLILVLGCYGRLIAFEGRIELVEGQQFDATAATVTRKGPWHDTDRLHRLSFAQGEFRTRYAAGVIRGETSSHVLVADTDIRFGDNLPLTIDGYRFYTTSNKGYSVLVSWAGIDGAEVYGAVNFPSFPLQEWNQINRWQTPRGEVVEFELGLPEVPADRPFVLDGQFAEPSMTLRFDADDAGPANPRRLNPAIGDLLQLDGGALRIEAIRLWMGYEIHFDPMLPWMFAAALTALLGLAWHFRSRFGPITRAPHGVVRNVGIAHG